MRYGEFDWFGYFEWLVNTVDIGEHEDMLPVLSYLFKKDYIWYKDLDGTQAMNGVALRKKYANEFCPEIDGDFKSKPCSVLEILVALSLAVEDDICGEPGEEDPGRWFWEWLENLGIDERCTGKGYSKDYLDQCIDDWLEGDITKNGKRSPFPVKRKGVDIRKKTLWMQCMAYVNEHI